MNSYTRKTVCFLLIGTIFGLGLLAGCTEQQKYAMERLFKTGKTRFLNPSRPIKAPEHSSLMPILPSVSVVDSAQELVPNATFPTDDDMSYSAADYVMGPGDVVDIGVMDLFADGIETVLRRQVTDSGFIDLPLIDKKLKAEDLTQQQLKDAIINVYSPDILQSPEVSVAIMAARQNTYSVVGAIARPGVYNVTGNDMRLLEAIALSGGITQMNIRYVYVFRQLPPTRREEEADAEADAGLEELPELPELPPEAPSKEGEQKDELEELPELPELPPEAPSKEGEQKDELEELEKALGGPDSEETTNEPEPESDQDSGPMGAYMLTETSSVAATGPAKPTASKTKTYKWVYSNGRWVRVVQEAEVAREPSGEGAAPVRPAGEQPKPKQTFDKSERSEVKPKTEPGRAEEPADEEDPFGWRKADKSHLGRIIAINLRKLNSGDPRMNIIIRDKDVVRIPTLEVGEFYVMGAVLRPGVYSLTGRRITMKQALSAAGNLGPLAWPENSILVRRIGDNQEQIIPVDIEAIFRGEEPDIMLKPDDVLAIGTDIRAPFMAVLRNAFRMTYGFGFIYDRNFADPYFSLNSKRFSRW